MAASIVWFRQDLRTEDNPALAEAAQRGPLVPLYIWSPEEDGEWAPGGASRWWLHQSLKGLQSELERLGTELVIRQGAASKVLTSLLSETGADAVFWNRRYEPDIVRRDAGIKSDLKSQGIEAESFNASLLFEPWEVEAKSGGPLKVFTPFWKACLRKAEPAEPSPAPNRLRPLDQPPDGLDLGDLQLEPGVDWAKGIRETWTSGSKGAREALDRFLEEAVAEYHSDRNRPDRPATSRLSPHLHFGEISPTTVWHAVREHAAVKAEKGEKGWTQGPESYLRELGWREFAYHLLFYFPYTVNEPLQPKFADFPWRDDSTAMEAWQRGQTGYPFVDAGMRELWVTGWMHNRVRMVVASFLVKDLLVAWQRGAAWFWDTLVDADLANNTLGWQWTAGCGADAAPYFRVFNPVTQGEKFDPEGRYVRRWVPELAKLPDRWIHKPWEAPKEVLREAGVRLGEDYPEPIVDHGEARNRALAAWEEIRQRK